MAFASGRPVLQGRVQSFWIAILLFLIAGAVNAQTSFYPPEARRMRRGEFIFFSKDVIELPERRATDLDYVKRFRVCLTNGYENFVGKELAELKAAGCELFLYFWFNGFYERELALTEGAESAYYRRFPALFARFRDIRRRPEWLLNPDKPLQGSGAAFPAYFYDYHNPEFRRFYIDFIRERMRESGYSGVFFDYIGSWALPEEVKALWKAKYPGVTYDQAGIQFLKELKQAIPGIRLFGNQAYRLPEGYYAYLDYDVSESHAVSFVWGKETRLFVQGKGMQTVRETFYRPWDGAAGYRAISKERRERAAQKRVRLYDINYLQPRYLPTGQMAQAEGVTVPVYAETVDRPAIFYAYALAKLTDASSFASDWYAPGYGRDDLYFLDLGKPLQTTFEEAENVVTRYFEKGCVVVTRKAERVVFTPDKGHLPSGVTGLWDVYEARHIAPEKVVIQPTYYPATQSCYPSGRIYLYIR